MVASGVIRPVDEDQLGQDDIGREEVVGIGEEAGASDGPNLPVEAVGVDVAADLVALVGVGLRGSAWESGNLRVWGFWGGLEGWSLFEGWSLGALRSRGNPNPR
jgi:hypothetical protein